MKKLALRTGLDLVVTSKCFFFIELFLLTLAFTASQISWQIRPDSHYKQGLLSVFNELVFSSLKY